MLTSSSTFTGGLGPIELRYTRAREKLGPCTVLVTPSCTNLPRPTTIPVPTRPHEHLRPRTPTPIGVPPDRNSPSAARRPLRHRHSPVPFNGLTEERAPPVSP